MVRPKTEEEIALMRENAILVSKTLAEVVSWVMTAFLLLSVFP